MRGDRQYRSRLSLARSLALFLARRGSQRVGVVALMLRKTRFPFFFSLFLSFLFDERAALNSVYFELFDWTEARNNWTSF